MKWSLKSRVLLPLMLLLLSLLLLKIMMTATMMMVRRLRRNITKMTLCEIMIIRSL